MKKTVPPPIPAKPAAVKKKSFPYLLLLVCLFSAWLVWRSTTPVLPKLAEPPRLYSQPARQDLRLTLLSAISKAKSSIYLVMFGLSDPSILSALQKKGQEGVPLTVYYDVNGSPNVRKHIPNAHPVHQSGIMHQKILIIDEKTVFVGSANFTAQSLRMHDNLVVGLVSPKIAEFLKERPPHSSGYLRTMVGGQDVEIWLLPDPKGHVLSDLRKKIRAASRSLRVALFTLTHPTLVEELIRAHRRGVQVTLLIDLHSALGASAEAVAALKAAHIPVIYSQGVQLLHHKLVYIDEQTLVTGSANWTKSAFSKNSDLLLTLHNLTPEQKRTMNRLWERLEATGKKS